MYPILLLAMFLLISCQKPTATEFKTNPESLILTKYFREDLQKIAPTHLHKAVLEKDFEAVRVSAQNGFDINTPNERFGETPLQMALELQDFEISDYLARFPILDIYHQNLNEEGYLFTASKNGMFRVIQVLFERHRHFNNLIRSVEYVYFDFKNKQGQRALHVALNPETAEALRLSGYWSSGRIFDKDQAGLTPLHQAALDRRNGVFQWASQTYCRPYQEYFRHSIFPDWMNEFLANGLKSGVEIARWVSPNFRWDWYNFIASNPFNYPDPDGNSPIHYAVVSNSAATVQAALTCRYANLSQLNQTQQSPLHLAAQSENPEILHAVLNGRLIHTWWTQRSEWLNQLDSHGLSPLHYAALNLHQTQNYQSLVAAGANVKQLTSSGQSADQLRQSTEHARQTARSLREH